MSNVEYARSLYLEACATTDEAIERNAPTSETDTIRAYANVRLLAGELHRAMYSPK